MIRKEYFKFRKIIHYCKSTCMYLDLIAECKFMTRPEGLCFFLPFIVLNQSRGFSIHTRCLGKCIAVLFACMHDCNTMVLCPLRLSLIVGIILVNDRLHCGGLVDTPLQLSLIMGSLRPPPIFTNYGVVETPSDCH